MYIRQLTNEEFSKFTDYFPLKSPYQTSSYALSMNTEEYDSMYLGLIDSNNVIIAASLILTKGVQGFKYAYAPKGFLIDYNNFNLLKTFTDEVKKFLAKEEIVAIKINPMIVKNVYNSDYGLTYTNPNYNNNFNALKDLGYNHLGYNDFFEALKPRFEAIIDIDKSPIFLFKNLRKEFKTKIRGAEKTGIRIHRGNQEHVEVLYEQIKNNYPRKLPYFKSLFHNFNKLGVVDLFYAKLDTSIHLQEVQKAYLDKESICFSLNDEIIKMKNKNSNKLITRKLEADKALEVEKEKLIQATNYLRDYPDGILLACSIIIRMGNTVHLFIDSYDLKYKSYNSKHLMIWKLIEKYSQMGYKKFNFGGISNLVTGNLHKYNGLNEFKLSFGANVYEYMGDLELITHKARYLMFRNIAPLRNVTKSKLNK